jgi:hypothetical protein
MRLIVATLAFYLLFSFEVEIEPIQDYLFLNNLSEDGVLNWLVYSIILNLFLISIGFFGFQSAGKKFHKKVFVALVVDGVISIFRALIFGYHEPMFIAPLSNSIPLAYILYSYFIYGKHD